MNYTWENTATVIGGGSWGTALANILGSHGYRTLLWMRSPDRVEEVNSKRTNSRYLGDFEIHENVEATLDLQHASRFSEVLIIAIPSKAFRQVSYELGNHVTGEQILVSATKGLEGESLRRMSEVLLEETCAKKVGALSGPNLAREILAGQPTATVIASPFQEVIETVEKRLAGPKFRLYGNFDLVGVEFAGALKNIYAIAAGVSAGLGFGANTLATLLTRGLAEMSRFGQRYGAQRITFQGLAGVGDLAATCGSTLSRNHTVGRRLAAGESLEAVIDSLGMVAEGVPTTRLIHAHALKESIDMPIAEAVHRLLFEGASPQEAIGQLMARASRYEDLDAPIRTRGTDDSSLKAQSPTPQKSS
jgi:glycerol-3-phosphate dehydrogenase (NAD(P)+)